VRRLKTKRIIDFRFHRNPLICRARLALLTFPVLLLLDSLEGLYVSVPAGDVGVRPGS
jgi:hypothetical protein